MAKKPISSGTKSKVSFSSALKKQGGWEKSRTAEDSFGQSVPDSVEDGTYVTKVSKAECGVSKKGDPYVRFSFAISRGDCKGAVLQVAHFLSPTKIVNGKAKGRTLEAKQEALTVDLTRLGYDMSETEEGDVEIMCKELTKDKPLVQVRVSTTGQGGRFANINKVLEDDNAGDESEDGEENEDAEEEGDSSEEGETEDGGEEESEDSEGSDEESEDEEEGEVTPEVNDMANVAGAKLTPKAKGKVECQIISVQPKAETVSVKYKGKITKGIAWADLEFVMEEE